MAFKLFRVFLPLICALQSPRFLSWSNENKEAHGGENREIEGFTFSSSITPVALPFCLSSFLPPSQARSTCLSNHDRGFQTPLPNCAHCQRIHVKVSWALGAKHTHTHTHPHLLTYSVVCVCVGCEGNAQATHTLAHSLAETVSSNFSLKENSHFTFLCSKGQFSSVGLQLACSNINYIYHFLMRPLKNIYPDYMSGKSEMSWGMSLLWVWAARQINKHSSTLKRTRWYKQGPDT